MNKELKYKWVVALRSGKYKQGRKQLQNSNNHFCCLGALCDVVDPGGWHGGQFIYAGVRAEAFLPISLSYKLDIDYDNELDLVNMNDTGKSFEEIANYIEEKL